MSKDDKANKSGKKGVHPDFDELLKQEQERMKSQENLDKEINAQENDDLGMPHEGEFVDLPEHEAPSHDDLMKDHDEISKELDDLLDGEDLDHFDENISLDDEDQKHQEQSHHEAEKPEHEEELQDLQQALGETHIEDTTPHDTFEEHFGAFDDDTEFDLDDDEEDKKTAEPQNKKPQKQKKPGGGLLGGGNIYYVIIFVVVIVFGYVIYSVFSGPSKKAPVQHTQVASGHNVGFRAPPQKVDNAKPKLPPAVPQNVNQPKTSVMGSNPDEILSGTGAHYSRGNNGITLLQVNKDQLAQLLNNFKQTVKENNKNVVNEVKTLKSSLGTINATQGKAAETNAQNLQKINAQIAGINKKFDTYNKHMSNINKALTKTQQQLKLILAERAENIDRYTLRAVVPGRAWLVDDQGKTITLTEGQKLKDYGKVVEINNKMGFVKMSSGFVFK